MNIKDRVKRLFRLRFAILYPLAVFVAVFANTTNESIRWGLCLIVPGVLLRLLSNGYAVKTEKLTTCGPYAFLRNPLYLGTLFILMGFVLLMRIYLVGSVALEAFVLAYVRTIRKEETLLEGIYKEEYRAYKKEVPSLIPRLVPYAKGESWSFSFERLLRSKEHKIFIWLAIAIIAFHLKSEIIVEKEVFDLRMIILIAVAFGLAAMDLAEELWRKKHHEG